MQIYQITYLSADEKTAQDTEAQISEGAKLVSSENIGHHLLAYPIKKAGKKYTEAIYSIVRISADKPDADKISQRLIKSENCIRFLMIGIRPKALAREAQPKREPLERIERKEPEGKMLEKTIKPVEKPEKLKKNEIIVQKPAKLIEKPKANKEKAVVKAEKKKTDIVKKPATKEPEAKEKQSEKDIQKQLDEKLAELLKE